MTWRWRGLRPRQVWRVAAGQGERGGDESKCNFHGATRKLCSALPDDKLVPADPNDVAAALAFALRYAGRKRVRTADAILAEIVAKRQVEHLERAGFVVMRKPPLGGHSALGRGFEG